MPKKIAIIEDDVEIKDIYKMKLELGGYDVVSAENGADAFKIIGKEKPDLILLDLLLPGKDGFEVLEELKKSKDAKLNSIPVVVLSNLSNENDIVEAMELGATDFLVKAKVDPSIILNKVNSVLGVK